MSRRNVMSFFFGPIACDVAGPARIEECSAVVKSTFDPEKIALRDIVTSSRLYRHRPNSSGKEIESNTYI
jgi:hypothetical protein